MAELSSLGRGTLRVQVNDQLNAKALHDLLDKVLKLHGCTACGLAGIDLHLKGDELAQFGNLKSLPGVQNIEFTRS